MGVGAASALGGVLEALGELDLVRQSGQGVEQRVAAEPVGSLPGVPAGLGIEQVGRRHVSQGLGRGQVPLIEGAGGVSVEIQRAESPVVVAQREGEHRGQAGFDRLRREPGEPVVGPQVWHDDALAGVIRQGARAFADLGLQPLVAQGCVVGGGDVVRVHARGDQGDPGGGHRQNVDDPLDEMIQDPLDREVGDQCAGELHQHLLQPRFPSAVHCYSRLSRIPDKGCRPR